MGDKGPPKSEPAPVPKWIVTFADLSTLMLTFFVLLISFSNQDVIKFREMLGSVRGAMGVDVRREGVFQAALTGNAAKEQKKKDKKKEEEQAVIKQLEKVASSVKQAISNAKIQKDVEVTNNRNGVKIRIKGESIFASGSFRINPKSVKFLNALAKAVKKAGLPLIVEGHTDNIPASGKLYKSNWELSARRASIVVRYMVSKKVPKKQLMAVGYGDMRPIADNSTPEGRKKNRRVEFRIKR